MLLLCVIVSVPMVCSCWVVLGVVTRMFYMIMSVAMQLQRCSGTF